MNPFGYSDPANPHRSIWNSIYGHSEQLQVPQPSSLGNMQPSRSHVSLQDLPAGFDNLNLDSRTATSTPATRHKTDSSLSRNSLLTPPADASASDPFLSTQVPIQNVSRDRNIRFESKADDDVFIGGAKPPVENEAKSATISHELSGRTSLNSKPTPRADRLSDPITPRNAQGVLPPEACVFVANLSVNRNDAELEASVHASFDQFGECVVKVRRDKHRHPFAIVQYHTIEAADQAVGGGRDLVVDDRTIRTERAQARRSVVLSRVGGGPISKDEAFELLSRYGPIEGTQPTTHADANHGIPEGIWVKFAYYSDSKDALKAFNSTTTLFNVMEPSSSEPRVRPNLVIASSPIGQGVRTPRSTTDQKSIFVGNLPHDVTEGELLEIFSAFGHIKGCNVIRKPITGGHGYNVFGFIEYASVLEAERASQSEIDIRQQRIRVEPKEYSARRHTRLQPFGQPASAERPQRGIAWGPSSNAYQGPTAMPYGFQPIYMQQPAFHPGYGYTTTTPPNSGQRRRAQTEDEYMYGGSPHAAQQYIPIGHPTYAAMPPLRDGEQEDYSAAQRRYR